MKALVLAGGTDQIALVENLQRRGYHVAIVDYYDHPPAATVANGHFRISILDEDAVRELARREQVALVATACTDQALLIAARVSEALSLRFPIAASSALKLTNKRWMKERLVAAAIPTARHQVFRDVNACAGSGLRFPLVCKPVDSNSSKGVTLVRGPAALGQAFAEALRASRSRDVICEEFIDGVELSIDAFVYGDRAQLVMVSESEKAANDSGAFPIVRSHHPARISAAAREQVPGLVQEVANAFGLRDTPLLIQAIAQEDQLFVVELSARIGGGCKHHFIEAVTGFDIMDAFVDTLTPARAPKAPRQAAPRAAVHIMQYLYAQIGVFDRLEGFEELRRAGVIRAYFPTKTRGMRVETQLNSSGRVAAVLFAGDSAAAIDGCIDTFNRQARVLDPDGRNILLPALPLSSS